MTLFERISKNRLFLMGVAILWVMPVHLTFDIPGGYAWLPLDFLLSIGYGGVDIFLFLSGFGLFCSLAKAPAVLPFYIRRLTRLLPSYLPAVAAWILLHVLLNAITPLEALGNVFAFGWWFDLQKQVNWYAQVILLLYLIAPLLARAVAAPQHRARNAALLFAGAFLLGIFPIFGQQVLTHMEEHRTITACARALLSSERLIAFSRLPIFLLGMYFGRAYVEKRSTRRLCPAALYAVMVVGLAVLGVCWRRLPESILWRYGIWWYPFFLITPGLCLLLATVADGLRRGCARVLTLGLERLGDASYEIYLVHFVLLQVMDWTWPINTFTRLLLIALSVVGGLAYARLVAPLRNTFGCIWPKKLNIP